MARRKELVNVAYGLAHSFNSRNNDVGGYWGIGRLYRLAVKQAVKSVQIELVTKRMYPSNPEFEPMIQKYQTLLFSMLSKLHIPQDWVKFVWIRVEFESEFKAEYHFYRSALAKPTTIKCEIVDDYGRQHVAFAYSNSRPHDPKKELRRYQQHSESNV
ncbi:MAG: hypothetical protein LWW74_03345 [Burkholderiales bacterium]|nr:hypothetical protein [Burkholderiales bacterium]MCE1176257.1 hypothetical protein [Burkholderiales bacterium]